MARSAYSALTYVLLLVAVAPLVLAVSLSALLDWYPWFLLLAMGLGLAWAGRRLLGAAQAALSRRLAALVQGEAAQAPGAWFVWIAVPAWTMGLGVILNVALDCSPPEEHGSVMLRIRHGKSPRVCLRDYWTADDSLCVDSRRLLYAFWVFGFCACGFATCKRCADQRHRIERRRQHIVGSRIRNRCSRMPDALHA